MNKNNYKQEIQCGMLLRVIWIDTLSKDGWFTRDEAVNWAKTDIGEIIDVGFLICETESYICISPSYSCQTQQYDYLKKIPVANIIKKQAIPTIDGEIGGIC